MKQQDRSLTMMFLVILILGFASGFLFVYQMLLPFVFDWQTSVSSLSMYYGLFSVISFLISPILVFTGIYYVGKKIDLKAKLGSIIIRLISAAFIGKLLGYFSAYLISGFEFEVFSGPIPSHLLSLSFSSLSMFFIAFTALSIAYIRHNDKMNNESKLPETMFE